jgi:hypothetical protein
LRLQNTAGFEVLAVGAVKNSMFWDIIQMFGRNMSPPSSKLKNKPLKKQE